MVQEHLQKVRSPVSFMYEMLRQNLVEGAKVVALCDQVVEFELVVVVGVEGLGEVFEHVLQVAGAAHHRRHIVRLQ